MTRPSPRALRRDDVLSREEGAELLVFDPETGAIHTMNEAARLLWDYCDRGPTLDELASALIDAYGLGPDVAVRDATVFVHRLEALGLVRLEAKEPGG